MSGEESTTDSSRRSVLKTVTKTLGAGGLVASGASPASAGHSYDACVTQDTPVKDRYCETKEYAEYHDCGVVYPHGNIKCYYCDPWSGCTSCVFYWVNFDTYAGCANYPYEDSGYVCRRHLNSC